MVANIYVIVLYPLGGNRSQWNAWINPAFGCPAGLENLSRRLVHAVDVLVLVADPSRRGLETLRRLQALARDMGIACGALVAVVATLWRGDPRLSVTVAVSMLVAMATAAMLGVLVPYFFRLVRIDPAIAAGPLVTTINDTTAISIYYLAAVVLVGR